MYQYLDAALLRAPALDIRSLDVPWPDLTSPDAGPGAWKAWLGQAWQAAGLAAAVETASPDLARQVDRILSGHDLPEAAVHRAVLSVLRYLLRGTTRATPFGLLAGVAPARIAPDAALRAGTGHRAAARPDAAWLAGIADSLEADDMLRPGLVVVASDLIARCNGHLVIAHRSSGPAGKAPERVQVRSIPPALAAIDAARRPVRVPVLAARLAADFPEASGTMIDGLIARLIRLGFLLTSVRAPMTSARPVSVLLAALESAAPDDVRAERLRELVGCLDCHDRAPDPAAARRERHRAAALMAGAHPVTGPALAVDLRLDWDIAVPEAAAAEAARAADILARLARLPSLSSAWAAWHSRFLDRYGPGAIVPVLDVTDDSTGLGFPAGYLGTAAPAPKTALTDRDRTLLALAQQAFMNGEQEIVLDEETAGRLSSPVPGDAVQPSAELTVRIHSPSVRALNSGSFTLHVLAASRAAGTVAGRFLYLLDPPDRQRMRDAYAGLPGLCQDSLLAQISSAPLHARSGNIARSMRAAGMLLSLGEHRPGHGPGHVPVSDLAVTADARRLHLVSVSRGQPVHTILPSAVDLSVHTHPLARFLLEAPVALAAPCSSFDWGAAWALPFVPAVRYGQAVLSPARWILDASRLPGPGAAFPRWDDAFTAWAGRARLPRYAYLGDGDRCIALDLDEPSHRALLRAQANRPGTARLRTAAAPEDLGWAGGRPHEITIPLAQAGPRAAPVRAHPEITRPGHGHLPGCDGRLYLKLYGPRDLQDTIITRRLPALAARTGSQAACWFIRYDDPAPHLRVRLTLSGPGFGAAAEQAGQWTSELRESGLITEVTWDTYHPETARFGGTAVMTCAEAFFAADSAAAAAQLTASASKDGPDGRALTAASMADITAALLGNDSEAMRWLAGHTRPASSPPPRAVCKQAAALVCDPAPFPRDGGSGIGQAWKARRAVLAEYRDALEQAGTISPADLLPDLLHLHHARVSGADITAERGCLHLARAAALSWLARSGKKAS